MKASLISQGQVNDLEPLSSVAGVIKAKPPVEVVIVNSPVQIDMMDDDDDDIDSLRISIQGYEAKLVVLSLQHRLLVWFLVNSL